MKRLGVYPSERLLSITQRTASFRFRGFGNGRMGEDYTAGALAYGCGKWRPCTRPRGGNPGKDNRQALNLQPQSPRRELNERHHRPARRNEIPHEPGAAHLRLGEPDGCHEVLPPDVLDERVIGVKSSRWPLQAVALKLQLPPDLRPQLGVGDNRRADFR